MITQELLTFMQQQLQAGKTREEIAGMLIPQGWELMDLNNAFAQVLGTATTVTSSATTPTSSMQNITQNTSYAYAQSASPSMAATSSPITSSVSSNASPVTSMNASSATMSSLHTDTPVTTNQSSVNNPAAAYFSSSVANTSPVSTTSSSSLYRMNQGSGAMTATSPSSSMQPLQINNASLVERFKNPTGMFAGVFSVLSLLVASLLSYVTQMSSAQQISTLAGMNANQILLISLGVLVVGMILSGLFTHLVTKILALPNRSFAKAFVHTASCFLVSTLIGLLTLVGVPGFITMLAVLVVWMVLFAYFYGTSFLKTLGAFFLNLLISFIFGGLVALAGISLVKKFMGSWVNQFSQQQQKNISDATVQGDTLIPDQPLSIKTPEQILRESLNQTTNPSDQGNLIDQRGAPVGQVADGVSDEVQKIQEVIKNPDYALIKAVVPADFPLPADKEVTTAYVIPATTYDPLQYRVEYSSTHSLAYLRNAMKKSLESNGYTVSLHESNAAYRYLFASKTTGKTIHDLVVVLKQVSDKESQVSLTLR